MNKLLRISLIFTTASIIGALLIFIGLTYNVAFSQSSILGFYICLVCVPVALTLWIVYIMQRRRNNSDNQPKKHPFFLVFGILDIFFILISSSWAIYDINTDEGWFAGLGGALMLMFVVPVLVIMLIIDIIVGLVVRNRRKK